MSEVTQCAFAAGLLTAAPPPADVVAWNSSHPGRRYGVYCNNVSAGLTAALAARFPAAERIVGAEFFQAMAEAYIHLQPPRSPLLLAYGDDFPDFASTFQPALEVAYLADVMRLEAARTRAYHAADAAPLDPKILARIEPDRLANIVLLPHPALSIVSSSHPAVTIWTMNAGKRPVAPIADCCGEHALVVRPRMIVEVVPLLSAGALFFRHLAQGLTLAEAAGAAAADDADFDLSSNLAILLQAGAFTALRKE
ncbi:DNA-binding domain-containing protein [Rhizobium sp. LjRoot30]|uniref:HvfC/BufC family peptide modification chaperone n=1 Tax=Rhizobium sp. LjRoot30 TaxID=3342320 RepID=UPI003ED1381E